MKILPWITEEYYSPLAPEEVLDRVQKNIAPPDRILESMFYLPDEPFKGSASGGAGGGSFDLHRITGGRNSSQPMIAGRVVTAQSGKGSTVRIQHKMYPLAALATLAWGAITGINLLNELGTSVSSGIRGNNLFILSLLMGVPFVSLFLFWTEVDKSRSLLVKLLRLEFIAKV